MAIFLFFFGSVFGGEILDAFLPMSLWRLLPKPLTLVTSKPNFFNPLLTNPAEVKVPKVAFFEDKNSIH